MKLKRYHIETSVSGSKVYSKLTDRPSTPTSEVRVQKSKMRRTLGYFIAQKFGPEAVKKKLKEYGFRSGNHSKVVVTWDWTPEAKAAARLAKIEFWDFRDIMRKINEKKIRDQRSYFTDDPLRTIKLFARAVADLSPPATHSS